VLGALALVALEEALPVVIRAALLPLVGGETAARVAEYWQLLLGPLFLLVVLYARGGIDGLLASSRRG
jgi:branched-chain amino acid transport system permease protein